MQAAYQASAPTRRGTKRLSGTPVLPVSHRGHSVPLVARDCPGLELPASAIAASVWSWGHVSVGGGRCLTPRHLQASYGVTNSP